MRQTRHFLIGFMLFISSTEIANAQINNPGEKAMVILTDKTGYAPVNGLSIYCEIYGKGQPLILMHEGFGSTGMWADILPELSKNNQVIAVDLQGHGRPATIDRPMRFETLSEDIAELMKYLGLNKPDVMGYSIGGEVTIQMGIRHRDLVRKLVVVSAAFKRTGWYPEVHAGLDRIATASANMMKMSPQYKTYTQINPKPDDWPKLHNQMGEMLRLDYDWTEDVKKIKSPILLVYADADGISPDHIVEFHKLLGGE
jgi:pimeloyl-ACP methyl ester carboxylesterase